MYKKNKFSKLFCFCAVVENDSSITKASKATNKTIPDISDQVRSLEIDLGYKLFDRISNKVVLNNRGRGFYEQVAKPAVTSVLGAYSDPEFTDIEQKKTKHNQYIKNVKKLFYAMLHRFNIVIYNKKIRISIKKDLEVKFKHMIFFILILLVSVALFCMHRINYVFDKKNG